MNKELLQAFCGTSTKCLVPWSEGEYTFATDAITLIRVPRLPDVPEIEHPYNLERVYKGAVPPMDGWLDIPGLDVLGEPVICPKCSSKPPTTCPECDGSGRIEFANAFNEYSCNCQSCDGGGEIGYCQECESAGPIEAIPSVNLGGASFGTTHLRKFLLLPNCKIAPPTGNNRFAWLKFNGGDGITMPRDKATT